MEYAGSEYGPGAIRQRSTAPSAPGNQWGHAIPVSTPRRFDVAAALRRLAADASRRTPTVEIARAAQAGQRLGVVCRWVLNEPDAAEHVDRIAEGPDRGPLTGEEMDVEGALVFACLLYLTGHPESAQF
ncbi:hypothetical protein [Streptomyces acidicola]|uniref:hypothetical protein n=1 Tax=Streptomyces acidicola TaxID=2596892 RepID=UPI00380BBAA2